MRFFGRPYPSSALRAPIYESIEQREVPVGERCYYCDRYFEPEDQGFELPHMGADGPGVSLIHRECMLETVLGPDWKKK